MNTPPIASRDVGAPFFIKRYALIPEDTIVVPRGQVLLTGFAGRTAYAWVQHHPESPMDMQLLTLPSEQPLSFEIDPNFAYPVHVGSFFKKDASGIIPSAWHVFRFLPVAPPSAIIRPN